jgi:hypothetical protein
MFWKLPKPPPGLDKYDTMLFWENELAKRNKGWRSEKSSRLIIRWGSFLIVVICGAWIFFDLPEFTQAKKEYEQLLLQKQKKELLKSKAKQPLKQ